MMRRRITALVRRRAARAESRRLALVDEGERYLAELVAEVGEPSARDIARAEAISRQIRTRHEPQAS